jgi:hypothetical protein
MTTAEPPTPTASKPNRVRPWSHSIDKGFSLVEAIRNGVLYLLAVCLFWHD